MTNGVVDDQSTREKSHRYWRTPLVEITINSYDKRRMIEQIVIPPVVCHLHALDEILYHPRGASLLVIDANLTNIYSPSFTKCYQPGMSSAPIDCIQKTAIAVTHLALSDFPTGLQKSTNYLQKRME